LFKRHRNSSNLRPTFEKRIGSLRSKTEDSLEVAVDTMMEERVDGFFQVEHGLEEIIKSLIEIEEELEAVRDLSGAMRGIRKLSPTQEDNFSLNDINDLTESVSRAFASLNIGGWAIAALSLIVGMFGVANIMFVTVRERTGQIGLKKAIGAKNRVILTEFLLESAFLCVIGGMIGLLLVFILTQILSRALSFPVYISTNNMVMAVGICVFVGVLAGFIPARQASRMDPVVAIRSK